MRFFSAETTVFFPFVSYLPPPKPPPRRPFPPWRSFCSPRSRRFRFRSFRRCPAARLRRVGRRWRACPRRPRDKEAYSRLQRRGGNSPRVPPYSPRCSKRLGAYIPFRLRRARRIGKEAPLLSLPTRCRQAFPNRKGTRPGHPKRPDIASAGNKRFFYAVLGQNIAFLISSFVERGKTQFLFDISPLIPCGENPAVRFGRQLG